MSGEPGAAFLSSVQGADFDGIRERAAEAGRQIGWRIRMAETTPPSPDSSRQTIRREIEASNVVLLMLGARVGTMLADEDISVVEDEYRMAKEIGRPVVVLLQRGVDFEPRQQEFIDRIRGEWSEGSWAPRLFDGAGDVGLNAIVPALVELERRGQEAEVEPFARDALETLLDAADHANSVVVARIIDEIERRRGRTDDVSFRTMFDLLCETPEFFSGLGDAVSRETERIGLILASAGPLVLGDQFAREHRDAIIESQAILRRFRARCGEVHFLAAVKERSPGLTDQLRGALDEMHDGLFERQQRLTEVKLALLDSEDAD